MNADDSKLRFSNRVSDYVKYRPSYPKAMLDFIFNELGLNEKIVIADIGSGTGIFTKLLLDRGATVYAVEPNVEMRTAAESNLNKYENFKSLASSAEQTGIEKSSVDMICAATAFHWFNPELTRVEWKRVLRPDGIAFLVWNSRKLTTPFMQEIEQILRQFGSGYYEAKKRNAEEKLGMTKLFSEEEAREIIYPNEQMLDLTSLVGRLLSSSYAPLDGHPNYVPMISALEEVFKKHQVQGKVKFEYESKAYFGPI